MADERARALRRAPTEGEQILWQLLRKRQIAGHRFRRQVRIGPFIADFACLERRVIIEVDGSSHETAERRQRDIARDQWLDAHRFRVLRLADGEVLEDQEAAIARICKFLGVDPQADCTTPTPTLPHQGGGS
ncbi:MAG: endonuclease domain-containing protein [Hyphomicrobium sp.]|nr:endonuclease domain-containing protein [Hyphomicrobium sp.]